MSLHRLRLPETRSVSPPRWGLLKDRSVSPLRLKESESVSLSVVSDALQHQGL